jgi:hypothetical protein
VGAREKVVTKEEPFFIPSNDLTSEHNLLKQMKRSFEANHDAARHRKPSIFGNDTDQSALSHQVKSPEIH